VAGRYALIVATDAYADPRLSRLRSPARDATALADVLRDPEIGEFEVSLAVNETDAVLRRRIATFFSDRRRDELLLLHFSCHGLKDDSGQLFFAAADTEVAHLDATAIPAEFVSRAMARSRSQNVLMLLDCCYSGAIARGLRFRAGDRVDVNDHLGGSGRAIITASNAMEYAFEGDELTGEGRPSVFTSAVVKALETGEADRDQDNWISVRELYDYVCDEVREITPNQRPNMLSHLEGELYVARSRWLAPATLPRELLDGLDNQFPAVRAGAVAALAELLHGRDRGLADAARRRLETVAATDDSRRVAAAASAALAAPTPAPAAAAAPPAREAPTPTPAAAAAPPAREAPTPTPPAAAAPPTPTPPAAASPAARRFSIPNQGPIPLPVLTVGVLLVVGWFLPWVYDGPVPSRAEDIDLDDRIGFAASFVGGVLALVLAGLPRIGRGARGAWPWVALTMLGATGIGAVVALIDSQRDSDYNAGVVMTVLGTLLALVIGSRRALARPVRPARWRVTPWDGLAALGGLLIIDGVNTMGTTLSAIAAAPTYVAGGLAILILGAHLALPLKPSRAAALVAAAAGAFALGSAGMAESEGRGTLVTGAVLALAAGLLAFRARTQP